MDWLNIATCADKRAMEITFCFDGESSPLGELETRELAKAQAYRQVFLDYIAENCAVKRCKTLCGS